MEERKRKKIKTAKYNAKMYNNKKAPAMNKTNQTASFFFFF